jgi:hypothetical protein
VDEQVVNQPLCLINGVAQRCGKTPPPGAYKFKVLQRFVRRVVNVIQKEKGQGLRDRRPAEISCFPLFEPQRPALFVVPKFDSVQLRRVPASKDEFQPPSNFTRP